MLPSVSTLTWHVCWLLQRAPGTVELAEGSSRKQVGRSAEAQLQNEVVPAPGVTRR